MAGLMAQVASAGVLDDAWRRVERRGAGPGVDGLTVEGYARDARTRLAALSRSLLDGTWRPRPGRRVRLLDDPDRRIVVAAVEDRVVQRALAVVLNAHYEPTLSDAAYAYRPGRSVAMALGEVDRHLGQGRTWFVRTDVRKFFDRIDRDRLLATLAADGIDPPIVRLIGRLLSAGAIEGAVLDEPGEGIGQGSALSPLLSNVYLRPVDAALTAAGFAYLRYADDVLALAETPQEATDALGLLTSEVEALGLRLNDRKTTRGHLREGFVFLGARFDERGRRPSAAAHAALAVRAAAAPGRVAALVEEWERWYGPLLAEEVEHPLVLWALLRRRPDAALARRRVALAGMATLAPGATLDGGGAPGAAGGTGAVRSPGAAGGTGAVRSPGAASGTGAVRSPGAASGTGAVGGPGAAGGTGAVGGPGAADAPGAADDVGAALVGAWRALGGPDGDAAALVEARHALAADGRREQAIAEVLAVPVAAVRALRADWAAAARAFAQAGALALAEAARALAGSARPERRQAEVAASDADLETIGACFAGRRDRHAVERRDKGAHHVAADTPGPLDGAGIARHLAGEARRGVYLVREDATVRFAVVETRVRRTVALPPWVARDDATGAEVVAAWRAWTRRAVDHLGAWSRAARRHGLASLLEDTGGGEHRLWFLFDGPLPMRHARELLTRLAEEAGPAPEGLGVSWLPASDRPGRAPGPHAWLPLGVHPRTGRRSTWLDAAGLPLAQPLAVLRSAERADVRRVTAIVRRGHQHPEVVQRRESEVLARLAEQPTATRVLTGCAVLRALARKAERLGHLETEERASLVEVLGHLPRGETEPTLCALLPGDPRLVRTRLERLPPFPASCARLAQRHTAVTREVGCDCRFRGLWGGAYPTPLLHAMRPDEIPAFRERMDARRRATGPAPAPRPGAAAAPAGAPPEDPAGARLPDHPAPDTAPAGALPRLALDTPPVTQDATQPATIDARAASRAETIAAEPGAAAPVAVEPARGRPAPVASGVDARPTQDGPTSADFQRALDRIGRLREALANAERGLQRATRDLDALFERAGTDRVPVRGATLVRQPGQPPRFRLERTEDV